MSIRYLCIAFASGAAGGLGNSLAVWLSGILGITGFFGVAIAPELTPAWLYPRIVWGGLWGFLLLAPLAARDILLRGLLISLAPTLVQLMVIFPFKAGTGFMGLELGSLTPLMVVLFNAVWGWVTVAMARRAGMQKLHSV